MSEIQPTGSKLKTLTFVFAVVLSAVDILAPNAWALTPPNQNTACLQANLRSLIIASEDAPSEDDVCSLALEKIDARASQVIADIKDVHERMAKLFHTTPDKLLPIGVNLTVRAGATGYNGTYNTEVSMTDSNIEVSTVPHPAHFLNKAIYAHELAHWLYDSKNQVIPELLRSAGQSFFWAESLADTAALALYGQITIPEPSVPACFGHRNFGINATYKLTNGYFSNEYQSRLTYACCEQVYKDGQTDSDAYRICARNEEANASNPIDPDVPLDAKPFSPRQAAADLRAFSRYQLGTPLNSFLLHLSQVTKEPVFQYFFDAAAEATGETYRCDLPGQGDIPAVEVPVYSFRTLLARLKTKLAPAARAKFDELFHVHALEALDTLEPAEMSQRATYLGIFRYLRPRATGTGTRLPEGHKCGIPLSMYETIGSFTDECALRCMKK